MNFWEKITGDDMTKELRSFELRAKALPEDYQEAWEKIKATLWNYSDFTGRNLMPILDGILGLLEEAAADGRKARNVLGDDVEGFCLALVGEEGSNARDRWRNQLNNAVAKKLHKRESEQ